MRPTHGHDGGTPVGSIPICSDHILRVYSLTTCIPAFKFLTLAVPSPRDTVGHAVMHPVCVRPGVRVAQPGKETMIPSCRTYNLRRRHSPVLSCPAAVKNSNSDRIQFGTFHPIPWDQKFPMNHWLTYLEIMHVVPLCSDEPDNLVISNIGDRWK